MNNEKSPFSYLNGEPLLIGDTVSVNIKHKAVVTDIYRAYTQQAKDYSCYETGGFMLTLEDGNVIVCHNADEDIVLLNHSHEKNDKN